MKTQSYTLLSAILLATGSAAQAQPLFTFESGLDGWTSSGFNARPVTLGTSPIGATHGLQALTLTQTGDGFSWNAKRDNIGQDAFALAMNQAALNPAQWRLELDVTYRDADIPDGSVTFLNLSLWMNSDAGFKNVHSLAFTGGHEDTTKNISVPLTDFAATPLAVNSSFYQLGIGMNGNWGAGSAVVYFDNIRLTPVPEPSTVALLSLGAVAGLGALLRRRKVAR